MILLSTVATRWNPLPLALWCRLSNIFRVVVENLDLRNPANMQPAPELTL
jgi:hypothetical protein